MDHLTQREQLMVALGSALGSNCIPCVERIIPKARAAGIQDAGIREAVDLADKVRRKPARLVLRTARASPTGADLDQVDDEGPCPLQKLGQKPQAEVSTCQG